MIKSLCVYCGSKSGNSVVYQQMAKEIGAFCGKNQIQIVYGGASVGLMGLMADACLEANGKVIGVIPKHLVDWEVAHTNLTELLIVSSMHERKAKMETLSDAFIAMPGGFGTLDELFEIVTWSQLKLHNKPIFLWNPTGYFDHLLAFIRHSVQEGFVTESHAKMIQSVRTLNEMIDHTRPSSS